METGGAPRALCAHVQERSWRVTAGRRLPTGQREGPHWRPTASRRTQAAGTEAGASGGTPAGVVRALGLLAGSAPAVRAGFASLCRSGLLFLSAGSPGPAVSQRGPARPPAAAGVEKRPGRAVTRPRGERRQGGQDGPPPSRVPWGPGAVVSAPRELTRPRVATALWGEAGGVLVPRQEGGSRGSGFSEDSQPVNGGASGLHGAPALPCSRTALLPPRRECPRGRQHRAVGEVWVARRPAGRRHEEPTRGWGGGTRFAAGRARLLRGSSAARLVRRPGSGFCATFAGSRPLSPTLYGTKSPAPSGPGPPAQG